MEKMKVRITTGYRDDQYVTIDIEEAHKAYYLFLNPEKRGVFENGVALIGKNIQQIQPDYHATMGWNASHKLDTDDWEELNTKNVGRKINYQLSIAKEIAGQVDAKPELMNKSLTECKKIIGLPANELGGGAFSNTKEFKSLADKFKVN